MCRRGHAREQQRPRMRHGVPDAKMIDLRDTNTNLSLEPREKNSRVRKCQMCVGSAQCLHKVAVWIICSA